MKTNHACKPNLEMTHEAARSIMNGLIPEQANPEDEWLSIQFHRIPFLLYRFWLILNFPIVFITEAFLIYAWYDKGFSGQETGKASPMTIGFMFFLYGCIEMLYAISKKKSKVAQEGFVKFQYALISSVSLAQVSLRHLVENPTELLWIQWSYMAFSPVVHLIGGFAVLRVFNLLYMRWTTVEINWTIKFNENLDLCEKKVQKTFWVGIKNNHPLTRLNASQASEEVGQDFLEQNGVVASELSKFDKQLNTCPYFVYKWILKFSVIFEFIFIFQGILPSLTQVWQEGIKNYKAHLLMAIFLIEWGVASLFNAYSCFQIEIATRTKNLEKSKRAIALLKICIMLSVIKCPFVVKCFDLEKNSDSEDLLIGFLGWFACSTLIPIFGLFGALKAREIIEEREEFVKVSSYLEDTYL